MKKKIITLGVICLLGLTFFFVVNPVEADAPWIINGNTVYVDDSLVYASATPHTIQSSGDVVFEFESKAYTGDVDFCWGFNGSFMKPDAIWLWQNISHENYYYEEQEAWGCVDFYNASSYTSLGIENYDNYSVTRGNKNNDYLFNVTYNDGNNTNIYAFTTYNNILDDYRLCGNYNRSVKVWDNQTYYDWNPWLVDYTHVSWNYKNMTDWYITPNLPITQNTRYKCKIHLQQQHWDLQQHSGKYWFAFKPSSETLNEAITNNHFYCLDPWWESDWDYYKACSISNKIGGYQMKLTVGNSTGGDVTCDGHAKSDFGDIRFVALDNSTEYPYWIENYTTNVQATIWINNTDNASTILMYYGNSVASTTSSGDDTFYAWDDFEDYSVDEVPKSSRGWTTAGVTANQYIKAAADPKDATNMVMKNQGSSSDDGTYCVLLNNWASDQLYKIHFDIYTPEISDSNIIIEHPNNAAGMTSLTHWSTNNNLRYRVGGTYYQFSPAYKPSTLSWHNIIEEFETADFDMYIDGADKDGALYSVGSYNSNHWEITGFKTRTAKFYIDNFYITNDTLGTSPSFSSFGSEQEQAPWSNTCPVSSAESPTNKSTGASISIGYWNVTINDADGNSTRGNITCSNGNFSEWGDQPNGTQSCPLALLDFATNYTVWVNFTDALGICSINETYWFITQNTPWDNTCPVSSAESPTNKSTGVNKDADFSIDINDVDGNTTSGNITCSNGEFQAWTDQANGTRTLTLATLSYSTNYTIYVNFTDALGICSINETYWFITQNTPAMTGISPSDGNNSVQPGTVNLSALFNDTDGDNMNVTFYYANNWTSIGSNTTITNGTYSQYISVGYGDVVSWGINLTDNTTWINNTYTFTVIDLNPVSSVVVSNYDSQGINLTWSKNSNVSHTYIRYKKVSSFDIAASGNTASYGLGTDGTNIYVVDTSTNDEVYKYTMDGTYVSNFDTAASGNENPAGLGTDGTNIYVTDNTDDKVYKYTMDGTYVSSFDTASSGNAEPSGLGTDGTNIWVADYIDEEIYKYTMDGTYVSSFDTAASGNVAPYGLGTDGTNIYVIDSPPSHDRVYKYTMDGTYVSNFDTAASGNENPAGLGTDGTNIYVTDAVDDKVYKYTMAETAGTLLVNTTDIFYNHSGLDLGTHYFYKLWGYNATDVVFSVSVYGDNYTNPGCPTNLQDTDNGTEQINFSWTKGTNATRSVVFINTSSATYPNITNGIEKINATGSTGTATGLSGDTTYYFSVYSFNPDSGLWSECNSTDSAATAIGAGNITGLTATRYNDVQLNLSWTKDVVDDDTLIVRKVGSYPSSVSDGTSVYNGSFSIYKDTGLTPATHYYYRAWSWDGEAFGIVYSSDSEKTRPSPPQDFTGDIQSGELVITWTKGTGATRTVIRNDTGSYPSTPTDGYSVYNNTGTTTTVAGISSIDYYRGWSYTVVDSEGIFSLSTTLLWGGIEINVYKENNPSIEIGNYTVFLSNPGEDETYYNISQNNPFRIDVSDVPNGEDITVKISKEGYKSRTQVKDLFENTYYTINFYLAPDEAGSPPGESDEPWYVPPITDETALQTVTESVDNHATDETLTADCDIEEIIAVYVFNNSIYGGWIEIGSDKYSYSGAIITVNSSVLDANSTTIKVEYYCDYSESYTNQYIIIVRDEIGNGIIDATIDIKKYINTTDSYETILTLPTDSSGQISCNLIPDVDYYFTITHDSGDYVNITATWAPPDYDTTKTYILEFTEVTPAPPDNTAGCISATGEISESTLYVNLTNSCDGDFTDAQIFVYANNLSNNLTTLLGSSSYTGTFDSYGANFTGIDNNNTFTIFIHYNHTYWEYQTITIIIDGTNVTDDDTTGEYVDSLFDVLYGTNPFGWHNFIMWIVLVVGMFYADQKDSGKILVVLGGVFLFLNFVVGFNSLIATAAGGALPALFIIVGVLVMWKDSKKNRG